MICIFRKQVVGPGKRILLTVAQRMAGAGEGRSESVGKRVIDDGDDDMDGSIACDTLEDLGSDSVKKRKTNKHGLIVLANGVVSMKKLALAEAVDSKYHSLDALSLYGANLSWGQAYALFSLVMCGKDLPVERVRDQEIRLKIAYSAQPYAIDQEQFSMILGSPPEQTLAYLHGMNKAAVQKLRYSLYGTVGNHFNSSVFTRSGHHPADLVRLHLGLKDLPTERSFLDMWV